MRKSAEKPSTQLKDVTLVFDCETNGLLDKLDTIHCISIYNVNENYAQLYVGNRIDIAITMLEYADTIIAHNAIGFDVPAIKKIRPNFNPRGRVIDTVLLSRLLYPDIRDRDIQFGFKDRGIKPNHTLESWGLRLGFPKGDYKKECEAEGIDPWASFNPAMGQYCLQDVKIAFELYKKLMTKECSESAIELEHDFALLMQRQEKHGIRFDKAGAVVLLAELTDTHALIKKELQEVFEPFYVGDGEFTPKRSNAKTGYVKDAPMCKVKLVDFNPASAAHVVNRLRNKYGWQPTVFTDKTNNPSVTRAVLATLGFPEARTLHRAEVVQDRREKIAQGQSAYLKLEKQGRLHGRVNTLGTVSRRCSHSSPNLAQVPSSRAKYGVEFRKLFLPDKGHVLVGCDANGLELRCLAHYMAIWDGGAFAEEAVKGDVHQRNADVFDCSRDTAKTLFYAMIFGAGPRKLAKEAGTTQAEATHMVEQFLAATPAYYSLKETIKDKLDNDYDLYTIDGSILRVRSHHSALNFLLQSAGAIIMKRAAVIADEVLQRTPLKPGLDYEFILNVHDELQLTVDPDHADYVGMTLEDSIRDAGLFYNAACEFAGTYKIGTSWLETH